MSVQKGQKQPTPFGVELGRRIRAVRVRRGWSLRTVQEKSGGEWKASVIGTWERGDRNPNVEQVFRLAQWYGVSAHGLLPPDPTGETAGETTR